MKVVIVSGDRSDVSGQPQNIGDAYLTDRLARRLLDQGHEVLILDAGFQEGNGGRLRRAGLKAISRSLPSADVLLIGGGSLLQDDQPARTFAGMPRLCLAARLLGLATKTKVVFWGVGSEVVSRRRARLALSAALAGCEVHVRDEASRAALQASTGKIATSISRDASLVGGWPAIERLPSTVGDRYVVVALAAAEAKALTAREVQLLSAESAKVVFVSMDQGCGSADVDSLPEATRLVFDEVLANRDVSTVERYIASAAAVVASRMHALYIAALHNVPTAAIGERTKIVEFADHYQIPRFDTVDSLRSITYARPVNRAVLDSDVEQAERSLAKVVAS